MDMEAVANELNDILPLIELAQSDHPEDYNLDIIHERVTKILEEIEDGEEEE